MPGKEVLVSIKGNSQELEKVLLDNRLHSEIKFAQDNENIPYSVFIIDLEKDLTQISQNLIDTYDICRKNRSKLSAVILHGDNIDTEKNQYFEKMLDSLGKNDPLHRLIFTKDIYQCISPTPATAFDLQLFNSITRKKTLISQKGENLFFPLSIEDFIKAIVKTLFLTNTAGKSFWLLGDSIADLELSYLLKKNTDIIGQDDLDINASGKNDPKTNTLLSLGNKTRAELNWQPESEFVDDLKKIVSQYSENPVLEEINHTKINPVYRFLNWAYKPRPKKPEQLPTIKNIGKKIFKSLLIILGMLIAVSMIATAFSLQLLEKSINEALNGNLKQSVNSLNYSVRLKEVGESSFSPLVPLSNLIIPKETEKIFNLFNFIDYGASSLENLHQTYVMAENLLLSLNNKENNVNYDDLSLALHSNLSRVYENINQIFFLSNGNKLPRFLNQKLINNEKFKNLKTLEGQVAEYIKVVDIIPSFLSGDKAKNILVLLQNSHVFRPSGGEVDYYLFLTISQGSLISKKYYTESELDKLYQSTASAVPKNNKTPAAQTIKLADITQNPDFSVASTNLASYLERALRMKPDFIVAINDLLIKQLLVEEKSQVAEQFESDFVEASGSAIFKELVDQYLDRLFKQDITLPVLGRTLAKEVGDNQILFWSADSDIERIIAGQSYSGVIALHPCNAGIISVGKCISETSYLNETTLQPSRESLWLSRELKHTIRITSAQIEHAYQIDYKTKNEGKTGIFTTTTLNLYLSSPSALDKVLLNDLPSSMKEISKSTNNQFDHYKIPLSYAVGQNNKVQITASSNMESIFQTPFSYSITEIRQPGTTDSGVQLKIIYPENLRPTVVTSSFTAEPSQMSLSLPPHTTTFGFVLDQNTQ